ERDEALRQHQAPGRMLPAHQRLDPRYCPASKMEDRLVREGDLLALQGALQVHLEFEAIDDRGVHLGLEDRVTTLAPRLGSVHGEVRIPKEQLAVIDAVC